MRKCVPSPRYFDLLGRASNDSPHTLYLGSDTGCMTQVIYNWTVGKWCAAEGSEVSGIREGYDHGFQNFYIIFTMIRSEGYL